MLGSSRPALIFWLLIPIFLVSAACSSSASNSPNRNSSQSTALQSKNISDWQSYENVRFGVSFQYPKSLELFQDQIDGSGIRLRSEGFALAIVANSESGRVEEYAELLLISARFEELRRDSFSKNGWSGLRIEGVAKDGLFEFPNTIYIVKSGESLLVMTAIWEIAPADRQLADAVWESFSLRLSRFQ